MIPPKRPTAEDNFAPKCRAKAKRRPSLRPPSRSIPVACEALPFLEPFRFPPSNVAVHWQDCIAPSGITSIGAIPEITPGIRREA
jgi:hypothetical protein